MGMNEWMKDFHYFLKEWITVCIMYAKELHSLETFSDYIKFQVENPYQFYLYSYSLPITTV